ncbi:hypothetical protein OSTOST_01059 [Ostertagia ostertagi]
MFEHEAARNFCKKDSSDLVSYHSGGERLFLQELAKKMFKIECPNTTPMMNSVWLLTNLKTQSTWADGSPTDYDPDIPSTLCYWVSLMCSVL